MFIKFVNSLNINSYRQIPSSDMSFGLGSAQQERKEMAKMTGYSMVAVTKRIKELSRSSSEVMTDLCRNKNMLSLQSRIEIKMLTKPQNLKNSFWLQRHVTVFKKRSGLTDFCIFVKIWREIAWTEKFRPLLRGPRRRVEFQRSRGHCVCSCTGPNVIEPFMAVVCQRS